MSPELWERAQSVVDAALEVQPHQRDAFLAQACGDDEGLLRNVQVAFETSGHGSDFLERSIDGCAPGLLLEVAEEAEELEDVSSAGERKAGDRVGPYRLIRELGRGGMGAVHLAERDDERYERLVAIKLIRLDGLSRELRRRFLLEQRILASLEHPHIARLYDAGAGEDGTPFIVMEYVDGHPIDAYCDEHRLGVAERLALFDQVCDAVQFAHGKLVVHRDLKPGNVLVSERRVVKLLDFGIAKLLRADDDAAADVTAIGGGRVLTPEYASPEQLRGEPVSTATDVYALGVLLFELLTGAWPYGRRDQTIRSLERAVLERDPDKPSAVVARAGSTPPPARRRELLGDLDNIVLTALSKEPERRYASVRDLRDDVARHLKHRPVIARPATLGYRAGRFARRHRVALVVGGVLAASLLTGLAGTTWQARAASRQALRADRVRDFLVELFEVSDPDRSKGDTITARALLDRGAARIDSELAAEPQTQAEMLGVIGKIYQKLGLYDQGRPLLERALSARREVYGPQSLEAAAGAADLSSLLYDQGEYKRAEQLARDALAVRRERLGMNDTLVSASLTNLAAIADGLGRLDEADSLYRAGLAIDRRIGAEEAVASDLSSLSVALWREGKYDEALPVADSALALRRRLHGNEHTSVAIDLFNLATIVMATGDYQRAEALFRECLTMRRKLLGDDHPYVALTLSNLGEVLQRQGRLAEAEAVDREALKIRRAAFGDDNLDVATSLNELGVVLYFKGDRKGAVEQFRRALAIWRPQLGDAHPTVLTGLNNLGATLREMGDLDGAERTLREALDLRRRALGEAHPDVAQSYNNLAEVLVRKKKYRQAEADFLTALATWRAALGPDHPTVAFALLGLGRMLVDQGRGAEAEPLLREALDIRLAKLEEGSVQVAYARLALGRCLVRLRGFEEAETLLLASYPVFEKVQGKDHETTRRARAALAELYRAWGRPADARRYTS